jgi:hypothetical protein
MYEYFRKKFLTSRLFILKSGMSTYTNAFHRSIPKVTNLKGPEEDLIAEHSTIIDFLLGRPFKPTTAAVFVLPLKFCMACERYYVTTDFPHS